MHLIAVISVDLIRPITNLEDGIKVETRRAVDFGASRGAGAHDEGRTIPKHAYQVTRRRALERIS